MPTRIINWNIDKRTEPWRQLVSLAHADVALLQEAGSIPPNMPDRVTTGGVEHWDSHVWNSRWYEGRFPKLYDRWPMVVQLSDRVEVEWFKQVSPISEVCSDEIAVSGIGTIAAARVSPRESPAEPFIVVSMYARWIKPHPSTRSNWRVGFPDGSAHRIISDLSVFIGDADPASHRILAAGDLNMVYGCVPDDPQSLATRERSVFDRFEALGLQFMGPQYPSGRRAAQPPHGLPSDSRNVPTYHTRSRRPATAEHQLDYVFASRGFHESVTVRALNSVKDWGASDHCRLQIDVA